MEVFRRRKFGGEPGPVPNDGFGDVYLVIDNYRALAEENEVLIEQVNVIINQGPSFGVHVVVTADRESELRPPVRSGFGSRVELRLAAVEDAKLVRSRFAKEVPVKPGRGMVAVNYVRLDSRPAGGPAHVGGSAGAGQHTRQRLRVRQQWSTAVSRLTSGQAPPVRRLPAKFGVEQVRELAARDTRQGVGAGGIAWAISELDLAPVYLNFAENAHLMVTGRRECGRYHDAGHHHVRNRPAVRAGSSSAPTPPAGKPSAQVWLVDPRRQLLTALGSDYVEKFAYNLDGVQAMMGAAGGAAGQPRTATRPVRGRAVVAVVVERSGDLLDRRRHPAAAGRVRFAAAPGRAMGDQGSRRRLARARHALVRWLVFGGQRPDVAGTASGECAVAGDGRRSRRGLHPRQDEGWPAASWSRPADGRGHRCVRAGGGDRVAQVETDSRCAGVGSGSRDQPQRSGNSLSAKVFDGKLISGV